MSDADSRSRTINPKVVAGELAKVGWHTYEAEFDSAVMMALKGDLVLQIHPDRVTGHELDLFATPEAGAMYPIDLLDGNLKEALEIIWSAIHE